MSDVQTDNKNELLDSLLGDFLDESDQLLTQLNRNLLQLDEWVQSLDDESGQRCDESLINEMFRAAHSLKGLSAMLGLTDINHLTHKIENVFDAARHDELAITRDVTELMFMGLDQLTALVGLLKEPSGDPVDCNAVLESIRRVLQTAGADKKQATQADAERALALSADVATPPAADPLAGIEDDRDIPDNYLSMFIDEADAALDALASGLLASEGRGSASDLKHLQGTVHKIKGSAASIGLNRAAKLAHLMEDALETAMAAGGSLPIATADSLLKCADGLRQHIADLKAGGRTSALLGPLACELLAAQPSDSAEVSTDKVPSSAPRTTEPHVPSAESRATYAGEITFQPNLPTTGLKAQLIYQKLLKVGEVFDCHPGPEELDSIECLDSFRFRVTTDQSAEALTGQLRVGDVLRVSVAPIAASPSAEHASASPQTAVPSSAAVSSPAAETSGTHPEAGASAGPRASTANSRPAETVRVDTERLDQLMDLAGQLVINKAQFSQIGERLKAVADCNRAARALDKLCGDLDKLGSAGTFRVDGQHSMAEMDSLFAQVRRLRSDLEPIRQEVHTLSRARDSVRELFEAIHQLDRVSDGIQKGVMDARMVPIGPLFARFNRVVRDIARASDKQIRLEILGEKTELDKRMIDELGDPLVHLVRNSADHGIEPPDQREAAGKPRQGTVTLDALHRGNCILIEVRDDGKGLDAERIRRKAIANGLVSEADAVRMSTAQIHQLIWKPGLSTAEKVTDVSGRGMGMDIVKAKIEELSGTVELASEWGKGTTVRIKLPLTLAILPSLMVEIAGQIFALPMEAVTEIVRVGKDQVHAVGGQPVATIRGRVVSLVRLTDVLAYHRLGNTDRNATTGDATLVVVNDAGREMGLAVDCVIGEEDVVIKSIAENYENIQGIAGASILGNGRVSLILDVPALIDSLTKNTNQMSPKGTVA